MNWRIPMVPLGQVARYRKQFIQISDTATYQRCRVQLHARGIVLRDVVEGAEIKTKEQQVCRAGDFLVAEIDAKVGGFGIVPDSLDGAIVSSHYFLFDLEDTVLERRFLGFFARTPWFREQVSAQGSTNYAAIRPNDVLAYRIPLPPLEEQERIVARVEELAAQVDKARALRRAATHEVEAFRTSAIERLLGTDVLGVWPAFLLGDVAEIRSGVTLGRALTGATVRLPYLRVANVQDGHLNLQSVKEVEIHQREVTKWRLQPGDVLLTEGGDWDKLGRGAVWRGEIPNCIHQNHIFRVRGNPAKFDPSFLAALIGSPYGKAYFRSASKQTTNLASINQTQLKAFQVYCPPLSAQRRFVALLDELRAKVDALKRLQLYTTAELDALLPSILDKAFKGEL